MKELLLGMLLVLLLLVLLPKPTGEGMGLVNGLSLALGVALGVALGERWEVFNGEGAGDIVGDVPRMKRHSVRMIDRFGDSARKPSTGKRGQPVTKRMNARCSAGVIELRMVNKKPMARLFSW